ncbi:MAG: NUDIX hydrolase [Cyanobacteria bacterium J06598_1]
MPKQSSWSHRVLHPARTLVQLMLRRPLVAASVIPVLPDGQIVLIRRQDTGLWGLPGGLVDWGETCQSAAKRELMEETGLVLTSVKRLVGVYSASRRDERFHSVCVAIAASVDGTIGDFDPNEVIEVEAFSPEALPAEVLAHDHRQQLQDYFAGRTAIA